MISKRYIDEWRANAPWVNEWNVEQDLVLSRAIINIFSDDILSSSLAFRGGTALHKLFILPSSRYSEDIDLVQISSEPIKETIDRLRNILSFLGKPAVKQKAHNNTLVFRFESETPPQIPLKLKVEINCREHFTVMGYQKHPYKVTSGWFAGDCIITTYNQDELLGTKLRALYQRKKGRDLFDLYKAIVSLPVNTQDIIKCYNEYMKFAVDHLPTQKEFLINLDEKMKDQEFLNDTVAILHPGEEYNSEKAYDIVRKEIIEKL